MGGGKYEKEEDNKHTELKKKMKESTGEEWERQKHKNNVRLRSGTGFEGGNLDMQPAPCRIDSGDRTIKRSKREKDNRDINKFAF